MTTEQLLAHGQWELRDAERRLRLCRRCPSDGGACEGAEGYYAEGQRPEWRDGHIERAHCNVWRAYAERRTLREARVPEVFLSATFESYRPQTEEHRTEVGKVTQYAKAVSGGDDSAMVLEGDTGLGKTHLAVAALRVIVAERSPVWFAYVPSFLDELRADATSREPGPLFERACGAKLLVLDDLGAERPTDFAREKLEHLLNRRWSEKRATIITQNIPLERLEDVMGAPLVRRIKDALSTYVSLRGDAYNG